MPMIGIAGKITDKLELVMAHKSTSFVIGSYSWSRQFRQSKTLAAKIMVA